MRIATTAERLQQVMNELDLQAVDVAKRAGISKSAVSRYLSGKYDPNQMAINKLAIALDVTEMWLWGYDVPRMRSDKQKENDDLVEITVRLRRDASFFNNVKSLYNLPAEDYKAISRLLATLNNK